MFRNGDDAGEVHEQDHEEDRRQDRQEPLAVLLAEQVVGDVDADEVEAHLDEALEAAGHELHACACRARRQSEQGDDREEADQHDAVDLEGRALEEDAPGKNSSIDGPWKPPSSVDIGTSRFRALASSAISCFGAWSSALASDERSDTRFSGHVRDAAATKPWGIAITLARLRAQPDDSPSGLSRSVGASAAARRR